MTTIKLCLVTLAVIALHLMCIVRPAFAQSPRVITVPAVRIVAKAAKRATTPAKPGCYTRPLHQGSGTVRICG